MNKKRLAITELIKKHAIEQPGKIAFVIDDMEVTYSELYERIASAALLLLGKGIGEDSHVLSVATPTIEFISFMYAILGLGAVHIPVENKIPVNRVREIAKSVDADLIISPENPDCGIDWLSGKEVSITENSAWEPNSISDKCSEIIFTTGTSGKSKGVMLSTHCLNVYISAMQPSFKLNRDSVFIVTTPLNHVGGIHRIHQCMSAGSAVILMDGIKNLKKFFLLINYYQVTHTYLPPASVKLILTLAKKELAKLDGKLQFIYTASAPFPTNDIETLISILPHTSLYQGYGSSETGSICSCCYNAPGETVSCLGKPYPIVDVKLLDEFGDVITKPNIEGRIISKSEMNMLGYYKDSELTSKVLKDGYVYSNDLMYFDKNGGLHFSGRGDDVINTKGFKVSPTELENIALQYPEINECVCIPYNDNIQGIIIKMLVVPAENVKLSTENIISFLADKVENYKIPKYIEEVQLIAKTHNGKIDRKQMINLYSNVS